MSGLSSTRRIRSIEKINSPHRVSNQHPYSLQHSALTATLPHASWTLTYCTYFDLVYGSWSCLWNVSDTAQEQEQELLLCPSTVPWRCVGVDRQKALHMFNVIKWMRRGLIVTCWLLHFSGKSPKPVGHKAVLAQEPECSSEDQFSIIAICLARC
jgi:hypothetical protein